MVELFADIPNRIREQAKFWVDLALQQNNPADTIKMVADYANSCINEEEREFVDFYFKMRLQQLENENNND